MKSVMLRLAQIKLFLVAFFLFIPGNLLAGSLRGDLNRTKGYIDDEYIYTLTIEGSVSGEITFPEVDGLEAREISKQSQSVISFNGISKVLKLQYLLQAQKIGDFEIPPLEVEVDGEKLKTRTLKLSISNAPKTASVDEGQLIFLEREISKKSVYVGEAIIVSDRINNRIDLIDAKLGDDRYPVELRQVGEIEKSASQQERFGFTYNVTELKRVLIPTKEGRYSIPPTTFIGVYADPSARPRDGFPWGGLLGRQNAKKMRVRSGQDEIDVKALPLEGRRKDYSGLVGEFSIDAKVSQREVSAGDNVNLSITIRGDGLTEGMADLNLSFPQSVKVYAEKPNSNDAIGDGLVIGERAFQYALVPTKSGELDLGDLKVQIFNPDMGMYQDISVNLGLISVSPGTDLGASESKSLARNQAPQNDDGQLNDQKDRLTAPAVEMKQRDISGLVDFGESSLLRPLLPKDFRYLLFMGGLGFLSPLLSLSWLYMKRTMPKRERLRMRKMALREFRAAYQSLVIASSDRPDCFDYRELQRALMKACMVHFDLSKVEFENLFLNDRQDPSLGDLNESLLSENATKKEFAKLWQQLNRWVYASSNHKPSSMDEIEVFVKHLENLIKELKVSFTS